MWSWWGPTWISVRCHGKRGWTSSRVGSAQTQRWAQMKPLATATPTHPCQVKTSPSDPQTNRGAVDMPAINTPLVSSQGWAFRLYRFLPFGTLSRYPSHPCGINCSTSSWWSGPDFSVCLSICPLSIFVERWWSEGGFPVLCRRLHYCVTLIVKCLAYYQSSIVHLLSEDVIIFKLLCTRCVWVIENIYQWNKTLASSITSTLRWVLLIFNRICE